MNARNEKADVTRAIRAYIGDFSQILDFDPETQIHTLSPFIADIDNAILELNNGNFEKACNNLRWLKLTVALDDAKRRGSK